MAFTQTITIEGIDEQALHGHVSAWDAEQAGTAPGYLGARVLADEDNPGRYVVEVDFASKEEARENNDRPETDAWASKLRQLASGEATYGNLREVCTTYARR